jgi:hypothetical protein
VSPLTGAEIAIVRRAAARHEARQRQRRLAIPIGYAIAAVIFFSFLGLLHVRDMKAVHRCERLGGQTWDAGVHCVLPGATVRNTR